MQYSQRPEYPTPNGARSFELAPYQITSSQYLKDAIVICVYRQMENKKLRLVAADPQSQDNLERFAQATMHLAPDTEADKLAWATRKVNSLLETPFENDAWYSHAPGIPPILMVDQGAIEGVMSLETAVRRSHMAQVADALSEGLSLPESVQQEYRVQIEAMSQRELH